MLDALCNVVKYGLSLPDAVYAATTAPAQAARLTDVGELAVGKKADLLLLAREPAPPPGTTG